MMPAVPGQVGRAMKHGNAAEPLVNLQSHISL